ncbi:hypothetical protein HWI79_498 [Cryptosporidium felis]|nr:hypothetical protein HWI79_498 [Cryptosporidium felis]
MEPAPDPCLPEWWPPSPKPEAAKPPPLLCGKADWCCAPSQKPEIPEPTPDTEFLPEPEPKDPDDWPPRPDP